MGKILQQLILTLGLVLYFFDLGSDIYVASQYWKNNDGWWFVMTTGFIAVPSIIVNIKAVIQVINFWRFIMTVIHWSVAVRYIETIISPYPRRLRETTSSHPPVTTESETTSPHSLLTIESETTSSHPLLTIGSETTSPDPPVTRQSETTSPDRSRLYFLARLRYVQTITESAPQLCLQVYIMLRQWDFPTYTVVSSVLSLLSLIWSIMTLEKERKIKEEVDYKLSAAVFFLIWQLSTLVSRLSAIVIFAYVFRSDVIIFLAAHWLLVSMAMLLIQRKERNCGNSLILSCRTAYPSLFHSSETVFSTANPKVEMITGYIFIMLENIYMVTLSLTIDNGLPHMDILKEVAILCLVGGSVLSIVFIILYYCCVVEDGMDLGDVITFSFLGVIVYF